MNRARRLLAAVALLATSVAACAAGLPAQFDPSRDAAADVAHAAALAKAQGKRVIVDVGGQWCAWCRILDRFIASHREVRALIDARYVWVKVNYSKENRNEALLSRWPRIAGYPHLFVLDGSGALVHSQDTGELESGKGYDEGRLLAFLCRASAQATCSRTSGDGSSARRTSASTIDASVAALPSATARLRDHRS